jgi:hypothetical protein
MSREQALLKPTPEEVQACAEFNALQIKAMTGAENMKKAGEYLGHKPTEKEAIDYFIKHEAKNFRKEHDYLVRDGKRKQ